MLNDAVCVLGSATPSLETLHNAEKKKYAKSSLTKRIDGRELPLIHLVDMRRESLRESTSHFVPASPWKRPPKVRRSGTKHSLPQPEGLQHNHALPGMRLCGTVQGLQYCNDLSPNRRLPEMPSLQLSKARSESMSGMPFIRHSKKRAWDAKNRGYCERPSSKQNRRNENRCGHDDEKNLFREVLDDFRRGKIDALVGTQMIAKGLDFPNVTLVGVVDGSPPENDFRASERAFQLLVQVGGRTRRQGRGGSTSKPMPCTHPRFNIRAKADHKNGFCEEELELRKEFGYPPYRHLIRHLFRGRSQEKVEFYAQQWKKRLDANPIPQADVKGPAPLHWKRSRGSTGTTCST